MPGIVTSTGLTGGSVKTYRAQFTATSTSVAINWVTGTTASSTGNNTAADKGVMVVFQNQSTGQSVYVGGADLAIVAPGAQGIVLGVASTSATNVASTYTVFSAGSFSNIQMGEWYVMATSSSASVVAQLTKGV